MLFTRPSASGRLAVALLPALVTALMPPSHSGLQMVWYDAFTGGSGSSPDAGHWNLINGYLNINGEYEVYTSSPRNVQISGGGSVQLVPWRDPSVGAGGWTSGRMESTAAFTPAPGGTTRVEGSIRMGSNGAAQKQGIWPAFWMLGSVIHQGVNWPTCGELDIVEQRNGLPTAFGTAHCGSTTNGGICNEPQGRGATTPMPSDINSAFHTWAVTWDLTNNTDWRNERIVWSVDGRDFFVLTGRALGDRATWATLAHSPFFIILNVAVGGNFPWVFFFLFSLKHFLASHPPLTNVTQRRPKCRYTGRLRQHDGGPVCGRVRGLETSKHSTHPSHISREQRLDGGRVMYALLE